MVVVLPAPFGPRNPTTSPGSTRRDTSSMAVRPPNRFVRPAASIKTERRRGRSPTVSRSLDLSVARRARLFVVRHDPLHHRIARQEEQAGQAPLSAGQHGDQRATGGELDGVRDPHGIAERLPDSSR